ncbi:glycosyltransferase family 2 protein [Paenibacillus sp.]|uniref:glycosyltransferase family 2 protein n=1 Tax=Paenibacillus sp. TaxID=58172 RepID=UPI002D4F78D9|nr:glycosyltransferase [Paenibacillus sp.]HZG88200.1 glycosyltransferase [Paenibacillus sp.]
MNEEASSTDERQTPMPITNAINPKVSVIIPVSNESKTIARVICEARHVHPETEVIVVINGSIDGSNRIAEEMGAKVIFNRDALGNDVGRAIGASAAKGSILLFMDGDIVIPAEQLSSFVTSVENGADVALNHYHGRIERNIPHSVAVSKRVLNTLLSRKDLGAASMTVIPHCLSRKALSVIGVENLAIPPLAHVIAVSEGLRVELAERVDVGALNRKHKKRKSRKVRELIIGDHLEAIQFLLEKSGDHRAYFTDVCRKRERVRKL